MVAPVLQSTSTTHSTGAAIVDPAMPSGLVNNNYLIAFIFLDINTTTMSSVPAGWTLREGPISGSASDERMYAYTKLTTGTETGTWTPSVLTRGWSIVFCRIDGNDTTTPFNTSANLSNAAATSSPIARCTTTVADCLIVNAISSDQSTVAPPVLTPPTDWTEVLDDENTGTNQNWGVGWRNWATASLAPAASWTHGYSDSSASISIAVAPASGDAWTFAVTESAGVTDSFAITQKPVKQDSVGITDSFVRQVSRALNSSDLVNLSDSIAITQGKSFTDNINLTDVFSTSQNKTFIDLVTMVDTFAKSQGKTFLDVVNITDSISMVLETGGVEYTINVLDLVGITDRLNFPVVFKDLVGITDFLAVTQKPTDTDSVALTDTFTILMIKNKIFQSLVDITDQFTIRQLKTFNDNVGLTDQLMFRQGKVYSDSAGLTDQFILRQNKVLSDVVNITDSFTALVGMVLSPIDTINVTDSISFVLDIGDPSMSFGSMVDRKRIVVQTYLSLSDTEVSRLTIDDLAFMYWAFRSGLAPEASSSTADHFVFVSPNGEHFIRDIIPISAGDGPLLPSTDLFPSTTRYPSGA